MSPAQEMMVCGWIDKLLPVNIVSGVCETKFILQKTWNKMFFFIINLEENKTF